MAASFAALYWIALAVGAIIVFLALKERLTKK